MTMKRKDKVLRAFLYTSALLISVLVLAGIVSFVVPDEVSSGQGTVVSVVPPPPGGDAVTAVRQALVQARTTAGKGGTVRVVFPRGRYDFFPDSCERRKYFESNTYVTDHRICAIVMEGMENVTIDGQGSEFIFHGPMQPVTVDHCRNIRLKDFSIDWDVPLTSQAQVVAATDKYIDIRIAEESPYVIRGGKIIFTGEGWESGWWGTIEFAKDSHLIPEGSGDRCLGDHWRKYRAEEIAPGVVRLHYSFGRLPAVGNYLVMRHNRREHAGVFLFHSRDVAVEDVRVYHTAGLGLLGQFSENLHFERVQVVPNPRKNRYFSGHDDGIHLSNCRGSIEISDCAFGGLMDDPVNVHGTSVRIIGKPAPDRLVCRFMHPMSVGMLWGHPGDTVGFILARRMITTGTGIVKSWKALDVTDFEITFREPVPAGIREGDALENLTWAPAVHIRGSLFGSCRARGVLISTPKQSVIEDCLFRSSGAAILVAGDANQWYESGAVQDLLIRNNVFESSCLTSVYQFGEGVISICPEIPEVDPSVPFHHNIRIENNTFLAYDYPVLWALSTDGLVFRNNTIMRNYDRKPWHWNHHMLTFKACKHVQVEGTRLVGDVLGKDILLQNMSSDELSVAPGEGLVVRGNE